LGWSSWPAPPYLPKLNIIAVIIVITITAKALLLGAKGARQSRRAFPCSATQQRGS
jgi:hypothetical protein